MNQPRPGLGVVEKIQRGPLREEVRDQIKQLILTNRLRPGQTIVIDRLASELGVSHTPVREALAMLQHEGLVIMKPYGNPQVADIDDTNVRDVWEMRFLLEGWAIQQAAQTLSDDETENLGRLLARARQDALQSRYDTHIESDIVLHNTIMQSVDNRLFGHMAQLVNDQSARIRSLVEAIAPIEEILTIIDEHCAIVDALRQREPQLARAKLVAHLQAGERRTLDALGKIQADTE